MSNLDVFINQVIQENDIPYKWNEVINQELDSIRCDFKKSREDLKKITFVTVAVYYTHMKLPTKRIV